MVMEWAHIRTHQTTIVLEKNPSKARLLNLNDKLTYRHLQQLPIKIRLQIIQSY